MLSSRDAFGYRSIVGTCLYLARDRLDLLFTQWFMSFASSRTQRVVSLSSCESELHAMVSLE